MIYLIMFGLEFKGTRGENEKLETRSKKEPRDFCHDSIKIHCN